MRRAPRVHPHVRPALWLLLQAHDYADDVGRNRWEFAVGFDELQRTGLTSADCRWLICKGWAENARELTPQPGAPRRFRHDLGLTISRRSCFVLTDNGVTMARRVAGQPSDEPQLLEVSPTSNVSLVRPTPRWDRDRHELRVGGTLVKQFKLPSPNQEMILMALEEESWPPRIDDPLPPSKKLDAKQRLHDTIKNLNRNQKHRLIRFMGDGTGQGVRWQLLSDAPPQSDDTSEQARHHAR